MDNFSFKTNAYELCNEELPEKKKNQLETAGKVKYPSTEKSGVKVLSSIVFHEWV